MHFYIWLLGQLNTICQCLSILLCFVCFVFYCFTWMRWYLALRNLKHSCDYLLLVPNGKFVELESPSQVSLLILYFHSPCLPVLPTPSFYLLFFFSPFIFLHFPFSFFSFTTLLHSTNFDIFSVPLTSKYLNFIYDFVFDPLTNICCIILRYFEFSYIYIAIGFLFNCII